MPSAEPLAVAIEGLTTSRTGTEDSRDRVLGVLHHIVAFEEHHTAKYVPTCFALDPLVAHTGNELC